MTHLPANQNVPAVERKTVLPHILVIDDDPLFCARVRKVSEKRKLRVTVCSSFSEVAAMSDSRLFDIAVVDYYLDDIKNCLLGTDIAGVLEAAPLILISNSDHPVANYTPFPVSVRRFINKRVGVDTILDAALKIGEENESQRT